MIKNGILGPILERDDFKVRFGVKSYFVPVRPGTIIKSMEGYSVFVTCIRVRGFRLSVKKTKNIYELASYIISETEPGYFTYALDV